MISEFHTAGVRFNKCSSIEYQVITVSLAQFVFIWLCLCCELVFWPTKNKHQFMEVLLFCINRQKLKKSTNKVALIHILPLVCAI